MQFPKYEMTLIRTVSGPDGEYDEWGNPTTSTTEELIKALTVADTTSNEQDGRVSVGKLVTLRESFGITSGDRVRYKGVEFEVVGELLDCNDGPGSFKPGYIMNLRRGAGNGV